MKLGEKIRYLREVEGSLRGLERAMSQQELVRAIETETGSKLSQSYLSQIESGARPTSSSASTPASVVTPIWGRLAGSAAITLIS